MRSKNKHNALNFAAILLVALLLPCFVFAQIAGVEGLINNGAHIVLKSGPFVVIEDVAGIPGEADFIIQDDAAPGYVEVDGSGTIKLEGDWYNNSTDAVFTSNAGTVEFNGNNQRIDGSHVTSFNNLTLSGNGTKTLYLSAIVGGGYTSPPDPNPPTGVLSLGATSALDLNGNQLNLFNPNSGGISCAAGGYIKSETKFPPYGSIDWFIGTTAGTYTVPFGDGSGFTTNLPVSFTTVGDAVDEGDIYFATYPTQGDTNYPLPDAVPTDVTHMGGDPDEIADRYWIIWPSHYTANPSLTNLAITFTAADVDGVQNVASLATSAQAQRFNTDNNVWGDYAPAGSLAGNTVTVANVAAADFFAVWSLVNSSTPLPIKLLNFSAVCNNENVYINWSTASETNNDYFTIERSADAVDFHAIDIISGAGNSNTVLNYSAVDRNPLNTTAYYRLKQTDFDGSEYKYSPLAVPVCDPKVKTKIVINESNKNNLNLTIISPTIQTYNICLFDATGRKIINERRNINEGVNEISFELHNLTISTDIYFLIFQNDFEVITNKILFH